MTDQPLEPRLEDEADEAVEEIEEEPSRSRGGGVRPGSGPRRVLPPPRGRLRQLPQADAREQAELVQRANERLMNELLPVLDDLERALEAAAEHEEAKLEEGVRLVHRSLHGLVERQVSPRSRPTAPFDPHVHEALLAQPGEGAEEGSVLQVLQKGYRLGDKVLRPARVIVAE